jgi:chaperone modulatory protein CbpM
MIELDDLLHQMRGLDRRELVRWVENRWVLPEPRDQTWIFHEVDVARVELILEIRQEFAIDEEALPLVLGLLDGRAGRRRARIAATDRTGNPARLTLIKPRL